MEKTEYKLEEAIIYLANNSVYGNEWQGAGMWEAVEALVVRIKTKKRVTESWLKLKLKEAKDR